MHVWPPECVIVPVITTPGAGKKQFLLMKACCAAGRDVMSDVSEGG